MQRQAKAVGAMAYSLDVSGLRGVGEAVTGNAERLGLLRREHAHLRGREVGNEIFVAGVGHVSIVVIIAIIATCFREYQLEMSTACMQTFMTSIQSTMSVIVNSRDPVEKHATTQTLIKSSQLVPLDREP